jgi:hypothetical protein
MERRSIMNKILKLNISDIIIDPALESEMISKACSRKMKMDVAGVCQCGDYLLISLEENDEERELIYVLAPFNSVNVDEIAAEITSRYFSGFSMIGGFDLKSEKWALFAVSQA